MKQYKLTNEKRASEVLDMLERLLSTDIFTRLNSAPKFIRNLLLKTKNGKEYKFYYDAVHVIKKNQFDHPNLALNHYLSDEYLSLDEAIFCIVGLNPMAIEMMGVNPRIVNRTANGLFLKRLLTQLSEGRRLYKAPRIGEPEGFISYSENRVYTAGLITWAIQKGYIEEISNRELIDYKKEKDKETGIPLYRLEIYKSTLPEYLESLPKTTSIRQLSINSNEQTEGEYSLMIKDELGVGPATIKTNLEVLVKTTWWKNQPELIRLKLPTNK